MNKGKKLNRLSMTTILLVLIVIIIIGYIVITRGSFIHISNKYTVLKEQKDILQLDILNTPYIGLNNKQLIKVTKDGITAYDLEGEELWSDTLTLDNFVVRQRAPYIAVANKSGKTITIFNEKGKQGEIACQNPIVYFSINKSGAAAVVEDAGNSHIISAYDSEGKALGIKGIIYSNDIGYPSAVELSPDNKILLASYINVNKPVLTSTIVAMKTQESEQKNLYDSLYGIEQKDNLIYEIEFIKDNEWVSVGDKTTTWYTLDGKKLSEKSNLFSQFNPYLVKTSRYGEGFLPIITATNINKSTIHRENELVYFNAKGEQYFNLKLKDAVTYFYSDDKSVVIGEKKHFTSYNKIGTKLFEYTTALDVNKVFCLEDRKKAIAVTKDKVILLEPKTEGE